MPAFGAGGGVHIRSGGGGPHSEQGGGGPHSERWGGPINVKKWWLISLPFFGVPWVSSHSTDKGVTIISPLSEELMCYISQHSELFCLLGFEVLREDFR